MAKMNEMVGMNNYLLIYGVKKRLQLLRHFTRQEFCKCIGCILSVITYGEERTHVLELNTNNCCQESTN